MLAPAMIQVATHAVDTGPRLQRPVSGVVLNSPAVAYRTYIRRAYAAGTHMRDLVSQVWSVPPRAGQESRLRMTSGTDQRGLDSLIKWRAASATTSHGQ